MSSFEKQNIKVERTLNFTDQLKFQKNQKCYLSIDNISNKATIFVGEKLEMSKEELIDMLSDLLKAVTLNTNTDVMSKKDFTFEEFHNMPLWKQLKWIDEHPGEYEKLYCKEEQK